MKNRLGTLPLMLSLIGLGKDASNIHPTDSVFRATGKELVRENSME